VKQPKVFRVLAYNIYTGANSRHHDRLPDVISVIRRADPDVVGVCECTDFDKNGRFEQLKRELQMDGVMNTAPSGHHVAVISKPAVAAMRPSAGSLTMYNGYATLSVDYPRFGRLGVTMSHLHPFSTLLRQAEMQVLLARSRRDTEAIVMGDMNTVSADGLTALSHMADYVATRLRDGNGQIDLSVIATALHNHFVDLGSVRCQPTYPTRLENKCERYGGQVRLDYILSTPNLATRCVRFEVIDDVLSHQASDHLPIYADFTVD